MSLISIVIQGQQYENICSGQLQWNKGFPVLKETFPLVSYTSLFHHSSLKLCSKVFHFVHLHLHSANFTKHIVGTMGYTASSAQNNGKNTDAEGKHAALAIIHACATYIKCYIGDDCTLLDCIRVMQHPRQKRV